MEWLGNTVKRALFFLSVAALLAPSVPNNATAQERYDTRLLFSKGAWETVLTHDGLDGELWCSAETLNDRGQHFSLIGYGSGQFTVMIIDNTWSIPGRKIRFRLDVDYKRWDMDGYGEDNAISITPDDVSSAIHFVDDVMQGNAVALYNADGRRLAVFSLGGSYASILKFVECWQTITGNRSYSSADPFGGNSDPF
ncbi:hypothetical protein [Pseudooceanicola marinus]|uniref:hypothetical protein n=1 Tax=Pseudooceanicola marinus TaxID=396013 RepID=UPI001CD479F0|nr:hypothetical protein [Pseudooceanicola marinus]MCA1337344.1 hypothetical protein [Pseudooceanicola marinus]